MYHFHVQIYTVNVQRDVGKIIEGMPPPANFSYEFLKSDEPKSALLAQADLILADLQGTDAARTLGVLISGKKPEAELIVLAGHDQLHTALDAAPEADDIWLMPMEEAELRFRFMKWQRDFKQRCDFGETKQFLNVSIEASPNMVWFKNRDGVYEVVNNSFSKAVGKTKDQMVGQRFAYVWDVEGDEDQIYEDDDLEVMSQKETLVFDEEIQTRGGLRQLTAYKAPLYNMDGSVMGTVGMAIDVTREKAYEMEIVEKNKTLEMLFSSMDCGVICHTLDGSRIVSINQAALRLLGYESQKEMEEHGFALVAQSVLEEDKPRMREAIASLKNVDDTANIEYRVQHKDGSLWNILGNIRLAEQDGELLYQRFLVDITDQKRREEERWAKKDREARYQEQLFDMFSTFLSDNVNDVYMMMNEDGSKLEFVSPNVERVLGIPAKDLMEDLTRIGIARYITGCEVGNAGLAKMEPGVFLEPMETERINQQTGERKWFHESVSCVSLQGVKKIIVYISDRTEERTTQNAMKEALEMAQVANQAKSTFLGNVSHDIRTPMNAIMGFVALLNDEADNVEHVKEYTKKISAASQHLLGLINDVLDMTKIESGSTSLNLTNLDISDLIEEINAIIRPQANAKGQSFDIYTSGLTSDKLQGDRLRINQILINILSNAVKYTQNGGKICLKVEESPGVKQNFCRLRFTVSDNGRGMSEEYQKVIFEPFTREHDTAWNRDQSTGLGMAITKSLVDLMNGTIKVTSKLGEGSTFVVELELHIQNEKDDDPEFWRECGIRRMLVVDDDEEICCEVVRIMAGTGLIIDYATDGAKALEKALESHSLGHPYDLILLDWKMPDLDGVATARLLRKNCPDPIPVMMFTAYDWSTIAKEALKVGIEHFVPKPFFLSDFKETVRRMHEKKQSTAPEIEPKSPVDGKRVMVVDDIDVNRMILVKILGKMGAICDEAEDGQEAFEKFLASEPGEYDLIMMDIQMPRMNGHEATRAIRACDHPSAWSIPIVAMTANAFVDDIRDSLEAGMDAHVPKPIVIDQLNRSLCEVMERRSREAGGTMSTPERGKDNGSLS